MDKATRFKDLVSKFQERRHRLTPQRMFLLEILSTSEKHPSAADLIRLIQKQFPTTSPATVYKTLAVLKEMGEVLELGFSTDDNRYDGIKPYPHPHLVCIKCRKIVDPDVSLIPSIDKEVAKRSGFQIVDHRLDFYGICPDCQKNNKRGK